MSVRVSGSCAPKAARRRLCLNLRYIAGSSAPKSSATTAAAPPPITNPSRPDATVIPAWSRIHSAAVKEIPAALSRWERRVSKSPLTKFPVRATADSFRLAGPALGAVSPR